MKQITTFFTKYFMESTNRRGWLITNYWYIFKIIYFVYVIFMKKKTSSLFKTTFCCKVMFKLNLTKHKGKHVKYFFLKFYKWSKNKT